MIDKAVANRTVEPKEHEYAGASTVIRIGSQWITATRMLLLPAKFMYTPLARTMVKASDEARGTCHPFAPSPH